MVAPAARAAPASSTKVRQVGVSTVSFSCSLCTTVGSPVPVPYSTVSVFPALSRPAARTTRSSPAPTSGSWYQDVVIEPVRSSAPGALKVPQTSVAAACPTGVGGGLGGNQPDPE